MSKQFPYALPVMRLSDVKHYWLGHTSPRERQVAHGMGDGSATKCPPGEGRGLVVRSPDDIGKYLRKRQHPRLWELSNTTPVRVLAHEKTNHLATEVLAQWAEARGYLKTSMVYDVECWDDESEGFDHEKFIDEALALAHMEELARKIVAAYPDPEHRPPEPALKQYEESELTPEGKSLARRLAGGTALREESATAYLYCEFETDLDGILSKDGLVLLPRGLAKFRCALMYEKNEEAVAFSGALTGAPTDASRVGWQGTVDAIAAAPTIYLDAIPLSRLIPSFVILGWPEELATALAQAPEHEALYREHKTFTCEGTPHVHALLKCMHPQHDSQVSSLDRHIRCAKLLRAYPASASGKGRMAAFGLLQYAWPISLDAGIRSHLDAQLSSLLAEYLAAGLITLDDRLPVLDEDPDKDPEVVYPGDEERKAMSGASPLKAAVHHGNVSATRLLINSVPLPVLMSKLQEIGHTDLLEFITSESGSRTEELLAMAREALLANTLSSAANDDSVGVSPAPRRRAKDV